MISNRGGPESCRPVKEFNFIRKFSTQKPKNKGKDENISPIILSLGLIVVIIFPISGFIIFCVMKNKNTESKAYLWAFRALALGSALCTIYVYIICSVYYNVKANHFEGDRLGYSFT